jgi:hypothetical protein
VVIINIRKINKVLGRFLGKRGNTSSMYIRRLKRGGSGGPATTAALIPSHPSISSLSAASKNHPYHENHLPVSVRKANADGEINQQ